MTFWDDEKSLTSSKPIELHEFTTSLEAWRYADSPSNEVYDGNTYVSKVIHGEKIESGSNPMKNQTCVRCDWEVPFVWQYIQCPPDGIVTYRRLRLQGSNAITVYKGVVINVSFQQRSQKDTRQAEITIDAESGDLRVDGLLLKYERTCGVCVYSLLCGVDEDASGQGFKATGNLTDVSGLVLTATEFGDEADGWWEGGDIVVNSRRRKVLSHSGTSVRISCLIPGLASGQSFVIRAGCDGTTTMCVNKFNGINNCRACPNIPTDDPFGANGVVV